jgi:hypothetical protein
MIKKAASTIITLLVGLAVFFMSPADSAACSLPPGTDSTRLSLEEQVSGVPVILYGNVIDNQIKKITVQVYYYFKGNGPATVIIDGFGHGADCSYIAPDGESIFFVWVNPDKTFEAGDYLGYPYLKPPKFGYFPTESYTPEVAAELVKIAGHPPVPPDSELLPWFVVGGAGLALVIAGVGGFWFWH